MYLFIYSVDLYRTWVPDFFHVLYKLNKIGKSLQLKGSQSNGVYKTFVNIFGVFTKKNMIC